MSKKSGAGEVVAVGVVVAGLLALLFRRWI